MTPDRSTSLWSCLITLNAEACLVTGSLDPFSLVYTIMTHIVRREIFLLT